MFSNVSAVIERKAHRGIARLFAAWPRRLSTPLGAAALFLAYLGLSEISYVFVFPPERSALFWLPSGLTLALFFHARAIPWAPWLFAIVLAQIVVVLPHGLPLPVAVAWGIANGLLSLSATLLIRRFAPAPFRIRGVVDVLLFVGLGAVAGAIPGALVAAAAAVAWLGAPSFWTMALAWWSSDALGILLLGPLVLTWITKEPHPSGGLLEALVLFATLIGVGWVIFGAVAPRGVLVSLPYLLIPFTAWAALRFGPRGATLSTVILDFLAVWQTMHGRGPFACMAESSAGGVLNVQIYVSVVTVFALLLSTVMAEQKEARAAAERAIRVREEFLAIASHELNTPLTSLLLSVQVLRTYLGASSEKILRSLTIIDRQTHRLARLVDELLSVSRITTGRLEMTLQEVDLAAIVRDAIDRFSEELSRIGCPISLHAEEPVIGRWDPVRLEQVAVNLIANAIKFGDKKPIEITVGEAAGTAWFIVRDHGIGIPRDRLPYLFTRFERAASPRAYGGLGLGLYIVRSIVEALGGSVRVESEPGEGATFTVELPIEGPPVRG